VWTWRRFCCLLSLSVWLRCSHSSAPPPYLRSLCCAIWASKATVCVILQKHCWVSCYPSRHLSMSEKLNSLSCYFLYFCVMGLHIMMCFLYCSMSTTLFGWFGHVQGKVHVRLYLLYPTSLPCHSGRHVENIQEISWFFKWDLDITSTTYALVDSSMVFNASFVHCRGCFPSNSSVQLPVLTTWWCSIAWTVLLNALVEHGGFPLQAAISWSHSSLCEPPLHYELSPSLSSTMWIYSHWIAGCCTFLRHLV